MVKILLPAHITKGMHNGVCNLQRTKNLKTALLMGFSAVKVQGCSAEILSYLDQQAMRVDVVAWAPLLLLWPVVMMQQGTAARQRTLSSLQHGNVCNKL